MCVNMSTLNMLTVLPLSIQLIFDCPVQNNVRKLFEPTFASNSASLLSQNIQRLVGVNSMLRLIAFAIVAIVTMRERAAIVSGKIARVAGGVSLRVVNEAKSVYDECCGRKKGTPGSLDGQHRDDNVDLAGENVWLKIFLPF